MTPTDTEEARIKYIRVTNGLEFPFHDRHDGVPYAIAPGTSMNIPPEVAAHFFGPDIDNKAVMLRHVSRRQGWNTPEYVKQNPDTHKTLADEYFEKLKVEPVMYRMVEVKPDPRKPVPADPEVVERKPIPGRARNPYLSGPETEQ